MITRRFAGHPISVAKQLSKIRTRDERERGCIVSLLCALTDEDAGEATRVEAVYFLGEKTAWDLLRIVEGESNVTRTIEGN
jgi:hypothetical protein